MMLATLAVDAVAPQPWRNGGGVTRELLTWPSAQAWGVRVSVADVVRDGPFSTFPGIDRCFAVLEGAGVELLFGDDGERVRVGAGDAPIRFDGARAVDCHLVSGPTRDLNVMAVRSRGHAACTPVRAGEVDSTRCALRAVFAREPALLFAGDERHVLPAMSLAWTSGAGRTPWRLEAHGAAWWIHFESREGR